MIESTLVGSLKRINRPVIHLRILTGGEDIAHNVLGGIIDPLKLLGDKKALRRDLKSEGVFIELNFGDGLVVVLRSVENCQQLNWS